MKKYRKVYLDMDGVIANFDELFRKLFGCEAHEYEDKHGSVAFWDAILEHRNFFYDIKPFSHMNHVITRCYEMGEKVVILSSPSKFNTSICIDQKRKWLDVYGCEDIAAIFEKEKYKFARSDCLLVDDFGPNIQKWVDAGGMAHQFKSFEEFDKFYLEWKKS